MYFEKQQLTFDNFAIASDMASNVAWHQFSITTLQGLTVTVKVARLQSPQFAWLHRRSHTQSAMWTGSLYEYNPSPLYGSQRWTVNSERWAPHLQSLHELQGASQSDILNKVRQCIGTLDTWGHPQAPTPNNRRRKCPRLTPWFAPSPLYCE